MLYNEGVKGDRMFTIICAMDKDKGIGYKGGMPWHYPEELAFFQQQTLFHKVVMGNNTYKSLSQPLKQRINIVFSKTGNQKDSQVLWMHDVERFIKDYQDCDEEIFITGGAYIYQQFLPYVDKMYISELKKSYPVDTYFPAFDKDEFDKKLIKSTEEFDVYLYERR